MASLLQLYNLEVPRLVTWESPGGLYWVQTLEALEVSLCCSCVVRDACRELLVHLMDTGLTCTSAAWNHSKDTYSVCMYVGICRYWVDTGTKYYKYVGMRWGLTPRFTRSFALLHAMYVCSYHSNRPVIDWGIGDLSNHTWAYRMYYKYVHTALLVCTMCVQNIPFK